MPLSEAIPQIERLFTQVRDAFQDMNKRLIILEVDKPKDDVPLPDVISRNRSPPPCGAAAALCGSRRASPGSPTRPRRKRSMLGTPPGWRSYPRKRARCGTCSRAHLAGPGG